MLSFLGYFRTLDYVCLNVEVLVNVFCLVHCVLLLILFSPRMCLWLSMLRSVSCYIGLPLCHFSKVYLISGYLYFSSFYYSCLSVGFFISYFWHVSFCDYLGLIAIFICYSCFWFHVGRSIVFGYYNIQGFLVRTVCLFIYVYG